MGEQAREEIVHNWGKWMDVMNGFSEYIEGVQNFEEDRKANNNQEQLLT